MTPVAPWAAQARAQARPMPRDAPVMATILPGSRFDPAIPGLKVAADAAVFELILS